MNFCLTFSGAKRPQSAAFTLRSPASAPFNLPFFSPRGKSKNKTGNSQHLLGRPHFLRIYLRDQKVRKIYGSPDFMVTNLIQQIIAECDVFSRGRARGLDSLRRSSGRPSEERGSDRTGRQRGGAVKQSIIRTRAGLQMVGFQHGNRN